MSYFTNLSDVKIKGHTEKKNNLDYLHWAYAWQQLKLVYPESYSTIYYNDQGWNYHTDGRTCWVRVGVTVVDGEKQYEIIEDLPVMDFRNKSIALDKVTSFDINKSIKRALTKAIAEHGLGISLYIGWDDDSIPTNPNEEVPEVRKIDQNEINTLAGMIDRAGVGIATIIDAYGVNNLSEMNNIQYGNCLRRLTATIEGKK